MAEQNKDEKIDVSDYRKMEIVNIEVDGVVRKQNVIKMEDTKGKDKIVLNITAKKA
jgi:hypothetical protein